LTPKRSKTSRKRLRAVARRDDHSELRRHYFSVGAVNLRPSGAPVSPASDVPYP
jgi:hypothetical protein